MAKKKRKLTKQFNKLKIYWKPAVLIVLSVLVGWLLHASSNNQEHPKNLIWAIDETVNVPRDLKRVLQKQNVCQSYRGPNTPQGVALWGVQQISKDKFAKVVHGCSWALESYVMLVKQDSEWQILEGKNYFADGLGNSGRSSLPKCEVLETYGIDQTIEPFCIDKNNKAKINSIK